MHYFPLLTGYEDNIFEVISNCTFKDQNLAANLLKKLTLRSSWSFFPKSAPSQISFLFSSRALSSTEACIWIFCCCCSSLKEKLPPCWSWVRGKNWIRSQASLIIAICLKLSAPPFNKKGFSVQAGLATPGHKSTRKSKTVIQVSWPQPEYQVEAFKE